jgi:enamine deaminase RidA (YjgF/YER057c/UK114 family)
MAERRYVNPDTVAPPGNFSVAVQHDRIVWLSGQVSRDRSGALVGPGDAEAQALQIYANVEAALRGLGGDLRHLVKTVTYVVGREHLPGVRRARERLIRERKLVNLPAGTLVLVAGLVNPEFLVEVDVTAVLD